MITYNGEFDEANGEFTFYGTNEEGGPHRTTVPYEAIANRMELLGYSDPIQALITIVFLEPTHQVSYRSLIEAYALGKPEAELAPLRAALRAAAEAPTPVPVRAEITEQGTVQGRASASVPMIPDRVKKPSAREYVGTTMRPAFQAMRFETVRELNPYIRLGTTPGEPVPEEPPGP